MLHCACGFQFNGDNPRQNQRSSANGQKSYPFTAHKNCGYERKYRFESENQCRSRCTRVLLCPGLKCERKSGGEKAGQQDRE
jgi:hypothetical protein